MKKEETKIQEKIIKYLNSKRIFNLRYQAAVNDFGIPDILACYNGIFLGLEVKTPEGKPTELQIRRIQSIRDSGGVAGLVTSVRDVEILLNVIDKA